MKDTDLSSNTRREFLRTLAVGGVLCLAPGVMSATQSLMKKSGIKNGVKQKPNIIIILADDQGYGDISSNSHDTPINTPNIDRLAKDGVLFTDGYACASMCLPSRAGIMTGRYPGRMGMYDVGADAMVGFPKNEKIAPQYFKELGYATAAFGKWHLGGEVEEFRYNYPLNKGFDKFWGFIDSTHDYWKADTGSGINSGGYTSCGYNPIYYQERKVERIRYLTYEITDKSIKFIEENKSKAFFLYVAHHCSHVPLQVPKETRDNFVSLGLGENTTTTRGMYEALDEGVGKILDKLDELNISENTIIIYSSDNGGGERCGQLNWIFRGGKFTFLEGGIREPMIIRWPAGLPKGKIYGNPVCNIDFLPTLLAAAEGKLDSKFEGVNLMPYLTGEKKGSPHEYLCWKLPEGTKNYAIRERDWKLVFTQVGYGLFNLRLDPRELNDLRTKYPDIHQRLQNHWNEWDKKNIPHRWTQEEMKKYWNKKIASEPEDEKPYQYSPTFGD